MITLEEGDYIVGFWFAYDKKGDDWMAFVKKPKNSKLFEGCYRFRDRVDEKLDNTSKDKKRWQSFVSKDENETEDEIIDKITNIQLAVQGRYPMLDIMLVRGDISLMMEKSKNHDWMHMQQIPLDEAKKKGFVK